MTVTRDEACKKVKVESEVAQSCPTLCDPMDCSLPGSSVHGTFQAGILEWVAIAFSLSPIPGQYEVPVSTGFPVVTKRGHKVAASLPAPLLGFLLFVF